MRAVIQRVTSASVAFENTKREIAKGLVILIAVKDSDTEVESSFVAEKCLNVRIFNDKAGKMNRSVLDEHGDILLISQFTLYGDTRKGRRPSYTDSAPPELAKKLYDHFVEQIRNSGLKVETGKFQAHMHVHIKNDGPVTLLVDK